MPLDDTAGDTVRQENIDYTLNPADNAQFGKMLREARDRYGYSNQHLADLATVSLSVIQKVVAGRAIIGTEKTAKLLMELGLDAEKMEPLLVRQREGVNIHRRAEKLKRDKRKAGDAKSAEPADPVPAAAIPIADEPASEPTPAEAALVEAGPGEGPGPAVAGWDYDFGEGPNMGYGKMIRAGRLAKGWSIPYAAEQIGCGKSTIGNTETGHNAYADVETVSFALGLDPIKMQVLRDQQFEYMRLHKKGQFKPGAKKGGRGPDRKPRAAGSGISSNVEVSLGASSRPRASIGDTAPLPAGMEAVALLPHFLELSKPERKTFLELITILETK